MSETHLRCGGACAIATACCAIAGATVGILNGLGGQDLSADSLEHLAYLDSHQSAYLMREWLFLLLAVFAIGEGIGLLFFLKKSPWTIWAFVAWTVGLSVGIVEDCAVIAIVNRAPALHLAAQDTTLLATSIELESIKVQQFVSLLISSTFACTLFSIEGYRQRVFSLWLCVVGVLSGLAIAAYGLCNIFASLEIFQPLFENGFSLMVVWDAWVGVTLLSHRTQSP